jgi:hypothetical protein
MGIIPIPVRLTDMSGRIQSESDLPSEFQSRLSSTFDYANIKQLLANTYYRGPIPKGEGGSGGHGLRKRGHVFMGMPGNHCDSVLRKATEVNIIVETSEGYVTTADGANILEKMMICEDCGTQEIAGLMPSGQGSYYTRHSTACPSCEDFRDQDKDGGMKLGKWYYFERDNDSLESAVDAMVANPDVELWLNGMPLPSAKKQI